MCRWLLESNVEAMSYQPGELHLGTPGITCIEDEPQLDSPHAAMFGVQRGEGIEDEP